MGKVLDVVNRFYEITERRKGDGLEEVLADDMTFLGPLMRSASAREYIALSKQLLPMHLRTTMIRQFEDGDHVCSIYEMTLRTPSGGTFVLPIADLIRVSGSKVAAQVLYYDPREFARAFGMV